MVFCYTRSKIAKTVCQCEYVPHTRICPQKSEEGIRSLGAEAIGGCELLDIGAGNRNLVFWKTNKCYNH